MIKKRMAHLRRKLASVATAREQRRKLRRRRGFKLVALAGYTNAGKSTLLNTLTSANAEVDDMLFTTLMPRTRAATASRKILLTDTVGFIDGLPPWMVEAFKATLEEIYLADLVVLILDVADPVDEMLRKLRASREILREYPVKVIMAINKIDKLSPAEVERRVGMLQTMPGEIVPISAMRGENIPQLMEAIRTNVWRG
jgi:GTP-binding protein HflX